MHQNKMLDHCRFCKSKKIHPIFKKDEVCIFKCTDCRTVFLGNRLNEGEIKNLYRYYDVNVLSNFFSPVTKLHYEQLLDKFKAYKKNNTILDVGCGAGYFMKTARGKGWDVEGTEIADEAIRLAEEKGQRILKGDIQFLDLKENRYDIVTLFEVIEHVIAPENLIKKLTYIVRQGGLVCMTTPNYNSIIRRISGNKWGIFHKEHLFYFTPKNLKVLLDKHNLKIRKIMTKNLSLIELSRIFKRSKAMDYNKSYEGQERLRGLTETNALFRGIKKLINFILNIFKAGDTIYIFAEKK